METGKIIKELRKRRGISAEQLADILGVAPSTVYRYENGDIEKMPYKILIPIAKALDCPIYCPKFSKKSAERQAFLHKKKAGFTLPHRKESIDSFSS